MKKLWDEFKAFAFKGNVVDLAVGMMIGSAFTGIVTALVNSVLMPLITVITGKVSFSDLKFNIWNTEIPYGELLNSIFSFLAVAVCVFALVKVINRVTSLHKKAEETEKPKEQPRLCPYCFQEIHKDATRCPHCTSVLEKK